MTRPLHLFLPVVGLVLALVAPPVAAQRLCDGERVAWRDGGRIDFAVRCSDGVALGDAGWAASVGRRAMVQPRDESALAALDVVVVDRLSRRVPLFLVESADPTEDGLALAARLAPQVEDGTLVLASPDFLVPHRSAAISVPPNDPMFGAQWYLDRIDILDAWALSTGDAATTISVVDNGCDLGHPDLVPHLLPGYDVFDDDADPSFLSGAAGNEHGTACAGIVGAVGDDGQGIAGTCPECTLRCVRLLGPAGTAIPISADVRAFELAIEWNVSVVSNSWGFVDPIMPPFALSSAVEAVFTEGRGGLGALVVFAAGNDDRELFDYEIEALTGVITVGAIRNRDEATSFSNHGNAVDLVAPTGTVTTDVTGAEGNDPGDYTALFGGTSSSAPVVSGVAALLFSAVPTATAQEVHDALIEGVRPAPYAMPDPGTGHDPLYGYGIVDPASSLRLLLGAHGLLDAGVPDVDAGAEVDAGAPPLPPASTCGCRASRQAPSLVLAGLVLALALVRRR